jgi:hypothetical protein
VRSLAIALAAVTFAAPLVGARDLVAQAPNEALLAQLERARVAAGQDHLGMYGRLCAVPIERAGLPEIDDPVPGAFPTIDPAREWYAEPAQVFDDLYWVGQTAFYARR